MTGGDLPFACRCGQVRGTLHDITPRAGMQLRCQCDDCRRAVIWLGQPDPGIEGVTYYQTTPARVSFENGALAAFTWKNEKLLRWYAPCCNTPLFNTLNSPKWAFASLSVAALNDPDALGPVRARAFIPKPNGKRGHENISAFMWGFAKRVIGGRLSGTWRNTPFFDDTGAPIVPVRALTREDRATAKL